MSGTGKIKILSAALPLFAVFVTLLLPQSASAIPAFARSLKLPCTLCHVGYPKLNKFGMDFKQRGYRMPGQEGKLLWEQAIPLAGRLNFSYQSRNDEVEMNMGMMGKVKTETKSSGLGLDSWQLLTGGTLAPKVSFFGMIVGEVDGLGPDATDPIDSTDPMAPRMVDTLSTEIATEAFIVQINDLLSDGLLNLRIGKDHVDNYFLSMPRRLTQANYLIQIQNMLGASLHPMSVGTELNGFHPVGLRYAAGVRNYSPAFDSAEGNEKRLGAYYAWANQSVMGQTLSLIVSGDKVGDVENNMDDKTMAYGASLDLYIGPLNIIPGYFMYNEGGNIRGGNELDVNSGTIEVIYPILSNLLATARYDFNEWDIENDAESTRDAKQYVVSLAWYQHPHVRWVAEYSQIETDNLMLMTMPGGFMLMPPQMMGMPSDSDQTRTNVALLLQVDF